MNGQDVGQKLINFWPKHTARDYVPLAFCNVVGQEEELVVTSDEGNERSKSNKQEKDKVVRAWKVLVVIIFSWSVSYVLKSKFNYRTWFDTFKMNAHGKTFPQAMSRWSFTWLLYEL